MKKRWVFFTALLGIFLLLTAVQTADAASKHSSKEKMIEAREKYFGKENVNSRTGNIKKDKVILSWFGVSNYAAAINGHVVLLDAWVPRGLFSGYVPASPDELAALKPEAVFIGHAHFDHAADAAAIIKKSGAALVGTEEHCNNVKKQLKGKRISCIKAVPEGSKAGAVSKLDFLKGVKVTAVQHVHSTAVKPDTSDPHLPLLTVPDISNAVKYPAKPGELSNLLKHVLDDDEGGTILYQFQTRRFALTWHDSSGPFKEKAPQLKDTLASLPQTDVEAGAIMGFDQYINGLRDPRLYMEALKPKVFIPSHHDNWAPPITTKAVNYQKPLAKEINRLKKADRPKVIFMKDPDHYVQPKRLTFSINDPKWR